MRELSVGEKQTILNLREEEKSIRAIAGVKVLDWPSQSLDLNPKQHAFSQKQELKEAALKAWISVFQ